MITIPDMRCASGMNLRAEIARQPWLTEREIAGALAEALLVDTYTEDELNEKYDEGVADGRDDMKAEMDDHAQDLKNTLADCRNMLESLRALADEDTKAEVDELLDEIDRRVDQ